MGGSDRRELANAACEFVFPGSQPGDHRTERFPDFLGANPAGVGLEGEAVGISVGIEAGHGMLLA
jgi:hypothetical protein